MGLASIVQNLCTSICYLKYTVSVYLISLFLNKLSFLICIYLFLSRGIS